jgi:hypothetical protein
MVQLRRESRLVARALLLGMALIVAMASAPARADGHNGEWERVSDKEGIVVERRAVDGSNLKEFLGRGVIDAPVAHVLAVIRDGNRRAEWMPNCNGAWVVEENMAARTQVAYHRTKAPWPVSDRDSINRAEIFVEPAKHRIFIPFEAIPDTRVPPVKGVVRMPALRGHWILVPIDGGKSTQVEYRVYANPGGLLPGWLANLASKTLPRETIAGLRRQVKKATYPEFEAEIASTPEAKQLMANSP